MQDMRMKRLQGLEREKLESERKELFDKITYFLSILEDRQKLLSIIKEEISQIKEKYADERKTQILDIEEDIDDIDMIDDEEVTITLTQNGYIKRMPIDSYKAQKRGGKGVSSITTRDEDFVEKLISTTNHCKAVFLTNRGRMYTTYVYKIPQSSKSAKGTNIVNIIPLEKEEKITAMLSIRKALENEKIVMCTRKGIIKKTELDKFGKSTKNGLIAINLQDDDELVSAKVTDGKNDVILVTKNGKSIMFNEKDIRATSRQSMGVIGIRLNSKDEVVSMEVVEESKNILIVTENGYGKKTDINEYKHQKRGGKGVIAYKVTERTGLVVGAKFIEENDDIMIVNSDGTLIRINQDEIRETGRVAQGVRLMKTNESKIVSFATIQVFDEEETEDETEE